MDHAPVQEMSPCNKNIYFLIVILFFVDFQTPELKGIFFVQAEDISPEGFGSINLYIL
jgi:hypothetical protein